MVIMELAGVRDKCESIHNRCEIASWLVTWKPDCDNWLHTLIEDIYEDAQELVDFCVRP